MKTITYKITDPRGIHARPAGQLVKVIAGFACDCKMGKPDALIDGKLWHKVMSSLYSLTVQTKKLQQKLY